jgi:hypothetical protein
MFRSNLRDPLRLYSVVVGFFSFSWEILSTPQHHHQLSILFRSRDRWTWERPEYRLQLSLYRFPGFPAENPSDLKF